MNTNPASNKALQRHTGFSRRHFLRGLGACIALPAFGSLLPTKLLAAAISPEGGLATTATGAPLRTAFVYFPNGAIPAAWWPATEGKDFQLSRTLQPLAASQKQIQVMGELELLTANPGADGGGDHARANGSFLTGVRLKKSATDIHDGISIDQAIANQVGHLTRFPSLELSCEAGRSSGVCDSGYSCAYLYNLAWSSSNTPVTPEANPRQVFERLFGTGGPGERVANSLRRRQEQRSILDFVMQDARSMQNRLGANDKGKLDQYLTGIRELETRIQKAERFGSVKDPMVPTPDGIPADYGQHMALMYDIMLLAFQTDSTRVATMLLSHDGSNRSFADIGVPEGHHDLSHHQNAADKIAKVSEIDLWYVKQFAKFLDKLQATKDVDGNSLLHNTMIVYGGGNADGNRHTHVNLPIILAGGGGGTLTPGRYVKQGGKPAANMYLSMADRMGVKNLERFGDSTGRLSDI
jgi:Protein of unknown function (DUF1552)